MARVHVGIDVAKDTLQVCAVGSFGKRGRKFANTKEGNAELLAWSGGLLKEGDEPRFCMEATGWYSLGIARHLVDAGHFVSVENPRFVKHFAQGAKIQNKTDESDALAIAEYVKRMDPPVWRQREAPRLELAQLLSRYGELGDEARACSNRLGNPHLPLAVRASLERTHAHLDEEAKGLLKGARALVASWAFLAEEVAAYALVPCVGELSAMRIAASLGNPADYESAQAFAAAAGVNPKRRESGTQKGKTTISRSGSPELRGDLYMTAVAAVRGNAPVKALYDRLLDKGKPKKSALLAAMRKLLMICYGVRRRLAKGLVPYGIRPSEEERKAERKAYEAEYRRKKKEARLAAKNAGEALTT